MTSNSANTQTDRNVFNEKIDRKKPIFKQNLHSYDNEHKISIRFRIFFTNILRYVYVWSIDHVHGNVHEFFVTSSIGHTDQSINFEKILNIFETSLPDAPVYIDTLSASISKSH